MLVADAERALVEYAPIFCCIKAVLGTGWTFFDGRGVHFPLWLRCFVILIAGPYQKTARPGTARNWPFAVISFAPPWTSG